MNKELDENIKQPNIEDKQNSREEEENIEESGEKDPMKKAIEDQLNKKGKKIYKLLKEELKKELREELKKELKEEITRENTIFSIFKNKSNKDEEITSLKEKYSQDLQSKDKEMASLKEKYSQELSLKDESIRSLEEKYSQELTSKDEAIRSLEEKHKQELTSKDEAIRSLEEKYKQELQSKDESIRSLEEKYSQELSLKDDEVENFKINYKNQNEEIEEYKSLFERYESILEKLSEEDFIEIREKLKISSKKSKEDYLRMACLTYNLDISKMLYDYYSIDLKKEPFRNKDKELIDVINDFFIKENITTWEVFLVPQEKFDKEFMVDIENPGRVFSKVETVYCPGIKLKENKVNFRALVKGK